MYRLTLVKPRIGRLGMERYVDKGRMEPLQLGVLAAYAPSGVEVRLWDDRVDDIPYDERTDAVFLTVETYTARRAYEISAQYRSRGVPVIIGGMHARLAPDECAEHADSVFVGDAENGFPRVLEDLRSGFLAPRYDAPCGFPSAGGMAAEGPASPTRRDLFRGKGYLGVSLVQRSRGCGRECTFCATSAYFGARRHERPDEEVLEEISRDCGPLVFFVDDNFTGDRGSVKEFLRKLIPLRRSWVSQFTADTADDPELLDLMRRSGCIGGVVGFKSISPASLVSMKKTRNGIGENTYERQIEAFSHVDLNLWAAFSLGHDGDTEESLLATLDFAQRNAFAFAAFNILTPYPGTPLYTRLAAEGRLLFDGVWWLDQAYRFNDATFVPANMSPERLTGLCWKLRSKILTRLGASSAAWLVSRRPDGESRWPSPISTIAGSSGLK